MQNLTEITKTTPLNTQQSVRPQEIMGITSAQPGVIHPLSTFLLAREDRVQDMRLTVRTEMMETAEMLMNPIKVTARAVFVPFLAFERFEGSLDRMNRSYEGQPDKEGGDVVSFIEQHNYDKTTPFYIALGLHHPNNTDCDTSYLEAYNAYVNFLYRNMSTKLTERTALDTTLAACPWSNGKYAFMVPDFDQALIDGELDLNINAARLPVKATNAPYNNNTTIRLPGSASGNAPPLDANGFFDFQEEIFAELSQQGVTLSLSNIEMAKKTAAFANIRKKMKGLEEDHILDLLMQGIRVPDAQLAQPILLAKNSTIIGYNRRYATDSGNLDQSVTRGETGLQLRVRTPQMNTGGVILVTVEIVPEQLYERGQDIGLTLGSAENFPHFTRDYLDPEKVDVVQNKDIDVLHSNPDATFAYAPLNWKWRTKPPSIGGKFMRQVGDPFDENRQRIWSVEQTDPELTTDFYLASNIHTKVFADQTADPFEITTLGGAKIVGHTVFGKGLHEDTEDYQKIIDEVDTDSIDQS